MTVEIAVSQAPEESIDLLEGGLAARLHGR